MASGVPAGKALEEKGAADGPEDAAEANEAVEEALCYAGVEGDVVDGDEGVDRNGSHKGNAVAEIKGGKGDVEHDEGYAESRLITRTDRVGERLL